MPAKMWTPRSTSPPFRCYSAAWSIYSKPWSKYSKHSFYDNPQTILIANAAWHCFLSQQCSTLVLFHYYFVRDVKKTL